MQKKECIAMILAGGQGTRLGALTTTMAKPAVPFGVKHRLIDFTLSNCSNSRVNAVGVLMPPSPFELHDHMQWSKDLRQSGTTAVYPLLPGGGQPYEGTAGAIYANIPFIERFNPELILVLSGDHIYKMDYRALIAYHKEKCASATIAVNGVPWCQASRFGIVNTGPDGVITKFTEKPLQPQSNQVSMGVYVFNWAVLKTYLSRDLADPASSHDFGKNIIPMMLAQGEDMYAYLFSGYWKDVGTVESLYEAHMDLLGEQPAFSICDEKWPFYSTRRGQAGLIVHDAEGNNLLHNSCTVHGRAEGTVLFSTVQVGKNATVRNSVILPGAIIGEGAYIERAIIGHGAIVDEGYTLRGGVDGVPPIAVVSDNSILSAMKMYAKGRC